MLDLRQPLFDHFAFLGAEAMERFGHEIIANALARQSAFETLDHGRRMSAYMIQRVSNLHDGVVKYPGARNVARTHSFKQADVQTRKKICAAAHTTVPASKQGVQEQFFRADEQRPI